MKLTDLLISIEKVVDSEKANAIVTQLQRDYSGEYVYIRTSHYKKLIDRNNCIAADFKNGMTHTQLGDKYSLSEAAIGIILRRRGLGVGKDERGMALTRRNQLIIADFKLKVPIRKMAKKYKLSITRVRQIIKQEEKLMNSLC